MSVSGLSGAPQGTVWGGSKPLHRFLRGQPKAIGTAMAVLGASLVFATVSVMAAFKAYRIWPSVPGTLVLGLLYFASGILYILTEHKPSKKTVTTSLALSIVAILVAFWSNFRLLITIRHYYVFRSYDFHDYDENNTITEIDNPSSSKYRLEEFVTAFEAILLFYSFLGAIIVIVMTFLAGAALRSTKTQAIIVMTSAQSATPVE